MNCYVVANNPFGRATLLAVSSATPNEAPSVAGRFFMARCTDGGPLDCVWDPYLRRVLHPTAYRVHEGAPLYTFLVPDGPDPGYRYLAARRVGDPVDLLGPAGAGFALNARLRSLLLVADVARAPLLFPLIHEMLDRGGRVTLLVRTPPAAAPAAAPAAPPPASPAAAHVDLILQSLPLAVEARAEPAATFGDALAELAAWADSVCLALEDNDPAAYGEISSSLRANRPRAVPGFAQVLWPGAMPCGIGACLGCLMPRADGGHTRSCIHGPVVDLLRIAA